METTTKTQDLSKNISRQQGRRVLIADDSASMRKFVTLSLKVIGCSVVSAVDGMDALEKLPSHEFDLIVTDLNMPNMDGYKFIRSLRQNPQYSEVPVIILSSLSHEEDIREGIQAGATSYVVKPFNAKRLQYEVSKYLA